MEEARKDYRSGPEPWIAQIDLRRIVIILIGIGIAAVCILIMVNAAEVRPVAPLGDSYIHFQYG